jgi:hypothetical protein
MRKPELDGAAAPGSMRNTAQPPPSACSPSATATACAASSAGASYNEAAGRDLRADRTAAEHMDRRAPWVTTCPVT